ASTAPCFTEAGQENFTAMVAAIGTGGIPRPNRRLLSHAARLPIKALPAFTKSVDLGWQNPAGVPLTRVTRSAQGSLDRDGRKRGLGGFAGMADAARSRHAGAVCLPEVWSVSGRAPLG